MTSSSTPAIEFLSPTPDPWRRFSIFSSWAVIAIALVVLTGWMSGIRILQMGIPGSIPMKANAAICFVLCGGAVLAWTRRTPTPGWQRLLVDIAAGLAFLIAFLTLLEYGLGWDLPIDDLFVEKPGLLPTMHPGRMAPIAALSFVFFSAALLSLRRHPRLAEAAVLLGLPLPFLCIIGYIYRVRLMFGMGVLTWISFPAAVGMLALGPAILFLLEETPVATLFKSDAVGGQMVRRLVPWAIAIPVIIGGVRLLGQDAGFYDTRMGAALYSLFCVSAFAAIVFWNARLLERADLRRLAIERALVRSNNDLEQFAYVASHDLQEPLRMVSNFTQLLGKRYRGKLDPDADEFIAFAVDGANRMHTLIQDLLEYSRVGRKGDRFAAVDTNESLAAAKANLEAAIRGSGARVTAETLPTVRGDRGQLIRLFQNLIDNAIKFRSRETPCIHVSASPPERGSGWVFSVRDNGIGIDPQYAERIFVIFQRLHTRAEYPGTGIGLAICKKIVERHEGRIWLESELGKGSVFYFTLNINEGGAHVQ
jgi:signal transduction histidine kinase